MHRHRDEQLCRLTDVRTIEPPGRDADDGHRLSVRDEGPTDNARVAGEAAAPVGVAQHDQRMATRRPVVVRGQRPPDRRWDPKDGEIAARHQLSADAVTLVADAEMHVEADSAEHAGEHLIVVPEIEIQRI